MKLEPLFRITTPCIYGSSVGLSQVRTTEPDFAERLMVLAGLFLRVVKVAIVDLDSLPDESMATI